MTSVNVIEGIKLKPYQEKTKERTISRLLRGDQALIGYEMGLGKTYTSLAIGMELLSQDVIAHVMICAPASLIPNWEESAARMGVRICTHSYDCRSPPIIDDGYLVILDESQCIKNRQSARWKRLRPALFQTTFRILLSGTPMPNKPVELFTQLELLGMKHSWRYFTTYFCGGRYTFVWMNGRRKKIWDTSGASHIDELKCVLVERGVMFLSKEDVMSDLPTLKHYIHWVPLMTIPKGRKRQRGGSSSVIEYATTLVGERIANVHVWTKVIELCKTERRTIVFAKHMAIAKHVERIMHEADIETTTINGLSHVSRRQDMLNTAARLGHVAICSVGAVSTGFNATQFTQVVFVESSWSAGDRMQCEARIHRIGQSKECSAHYVFMKGTIDEKLWKTLLRKGHIISNVHAR